MSTTKAAATYTAEDLLRMPDTGAVRYELVAGELCVMEPARSAHGLVSVNVLGVLDPHVRAHALGALFTADTGFHLKRDPDTVRAPDVSFVRADRLPPDGLDNAAGFLELAPDLAVEVVSPSDSVSRLGEKIEEYLAVGVRLIWVVDPANRTVAVHNVSRVVRTLGEEHTLDGGDVVPGFRCAVAELFVGVRRA